MRNYHIYFILFILCLLNCSKESNYNMEKAIKPKLKNSWYDANKAGYGHMLLKKINGSFEMHMELNDGSTYIKKLHKWGPRYIDESGAYYMISESGDLGVYDSEGLIKIIPKT